jgi:type I restriction enzyme S subunit
VEYTRKVQRKDFLLEGQFPIVSQEAEFTNGFWDDEADLFKLSKPVVVFGDHTQVLKYVDFDFVLGADGVKILQPRNFLWPKFFFYQLQAAELPSLGYARHYRLFKELEISVPPLAEQQRIVGVLDEAFAGLATAQAHAAQNLQNARALFESHLQSVFTHRGKGWVETTLGKVYEFKNGMNFDKTQKGERGTPTIDVLNMYGDNLEVQLGNLYRITKPVPLDYVLKEGDILVVRSSVKREGVGWPALFRSGSEPITFCGFIIRGRPVAQVQAEYVIHFLRCRTTREELVSSAKQATITNINQTTLGALRIPLPSLGEQRETVAQLDALAAETQRLTRLYEQKQAALAALKKSLLHQAFIGEL